MSIVKQMWLRGLVHQVTHDAIDDVLGAEPRVVYAGFDPTADNLHIGHLVPALGLMRLQHAGHRPIALVGSGTGLIGDPSGRDDERQLLSVEEVEHNSGALRKILEHFLDFDDPKIGAKLLNNYDWLGAFGYLEFLRDVGKHFSINAMLAKESVRSRIEDRGHGMSYTEFSYMLLQAYDFLHLFDAERCILQIGGSDQWGNIVAGIDLIRRVRGGEAYGMTFPLITRADGSKFGKSVGGNVWLGAHGTSPYDFYQYWIRTDDRDVIGYLRIFTLLPEERIAELGTELHRAADQRLAQSVLADEVTRLVHGEDGLRVARKATEVLYGGDVTDLTDDEVTAIFKDVASVELERRGLDGDGLPLVEALVASGAAPSRGAARRLVEGGGVYVNNCRVTDTDRVLSAADLASRSYILLRKGKRDFYLLRFAS